MTHILNRSRKLFSDKKVRQLEPVKSVHVAIIGSRKVRRSQILQNFFKWTPEGRTILTSLRSAQRSVLVVNLVDREGYRPFYEQAVSESEIILLVKEDTDNTETFTGFIEEIQQKKDGHPSQVFIASNSKYNHNLKEVYPVLKGVQYSLCQYYQNIKVNAVSPDFSLAQHFLDQVCCGM